LVLGLCVGVVYVECAMDGADVVETLWVHVFTVIHLVDMDHMGDSLWILGMVFALSPNHP
jgi:hypothetical protein